VLLDVMEQLLEEPLFDALRTQQQLGYSVSCGARWTAGTCGFGVRVLRWVGYIGRTGDWWFSFLFRLLTSFLAYFFSIFTSYFFDLNFLFVFFLRAFTG
jgi:hypothetical protein